MDRLSAALESVKEKEETIEQWQVWTAELQESLEVVSEAWEFVEIAITDSDVHHRHAPDECDYCDAIWAMLMVIRDHTLGLL